MRASKRITMRASRRILVVVAATVVMIAAFAVPALAGAEGTLLSRINNSRANAGLPPVERYWDLTDDARAHTEAMISAGHIYHNPGLSGVTGVWQALGENVGVGIDANSLHDAFMASSSHRSNILGDFNYVGIGATTDADGLVWATVVFMKAAPGLNGGGETTTTVAPTTTTTVAPTTTTTVAPSTVPPVPGDGSVGGDTASGASAPSTTTTVPAARPAATAAPAGGADAGPVGDQPPRFERYGSPDGLPAFAI